MLQPLWLGALNPVSGMGESHVRVSIAELSCQSTAICSHKGTKPLSADYIYWCITRACREQVHVEEWMNHRKHKIHKIDFVVLFCVLCAFCGSNLSNACP